MTNTPHGLRRFLRLLAPFLGATLCTAVSGAQRVGESVAQALFEEARLLMLDNRTPEACPKFAESLRLDPALGTLLNLALCHEKQGKTATAYLEYTDAIAQAARESDTERHALAQQRISALEPRVIRLAIRTTFAPPPGIWISLDGTRLGAAALDAALPIDPGTYTIEYGAPGKSSKKVSLSVSEDELRPELALSGLDALPTPKPIPAPAASVGASKRVPTNGASESRRGNTRSLATGAVLGGALAALAFGTFSGIQAGLEWSKRNEHCQGGCDQDAKTFGDSARNLARLSNISFGVGLAAAGAGIYLFATKPQEETRAGIKLNATAEPRRAMLTVGGRL